MIAAAVLASWFVVQVIGVRRDTAGIVLMEGSVVLMALAAAAVCLLAARRVEAAQASAWRLFAAAAAFWGLGEVAWMVANLRGDELPLPSAADAGYLLFPVFMAGGLLRLLVTTDGALSRVRAMLDGLLIAGSVLVIVWIVAIGRLSREPAVDGWLAKLLGLAYPLSDVVLITLVVYLIVRVRHEGRSVPPGLGFIAAGLFAMAVADVAFVYTTLTGTFDESSPFDTGWIGTFAFMAVAGLRAITSDPRNSNGDGASRPVALFVPYAALCIAGLVTVVSRGRVEAELLTIWIVLIAALMVRQIITLQENRTLTVELENRVVARTRALAASEQRFRALVQRSSDVVVVVDVEGIVRYITDSVERVFGRHPESIVGRRARSFATPAGSEVLAAHVGEAIANGDHVRTVEVELVHADGTPRQAEVVITNMLDDPSVCGLVMNVRDVSAQRALEARLVHDAFHDSLTGLPNRSLLSERLAHALTRRGQDRRIAILFIDLDDFKRVNDTLGHGAGDALLIEVAARLRRSVRESETVARLGGDEFAILIEDAETSFSPTMVAERVCEVLRPEVAVAGREIPIRASIGIAVADAGDDEHKLLQSADLAMYRAKATEAGGYVVYDPAMQSDYFARVQLEEDLRHAVAERRLTVAYQPIFDLDSGRMVGAEALARWDDPERGSVSPGEFIGVAEESGLIHEVGRFVQAAAISQLAAWAHVAEAAQLRISLNVSADELRTGELAATIGQMLTRSGVSGDRLVLEITESVLVDNSDETLETLRALRGLGVRIAIDDFGTGYSSLGYLHRFPFDILKVDRSFVEHLGVRERDSEFVRTIVDLGRNLDLVTVAEGVETLDQWEALLMAGCRQGQGRVFSMPIDAETLDARLVEWVTSGAVALAAPVGAASEAT